MANEHDEQSVSAVSTSELVSLVEQAIGCLTEGCTGKQYDSSWIRPRAMTRQEVQTACEQAYHWMHKVKEALEANPNQKPRLNHDDDSLKDTKNSVNL